MFISTFFTPLYAQNSAQGNAPVNPSGTSAQGNAPSNNGTFTLSNPLKVDSIGGLVITLLEVVTYVLILFAVLALIFVGFRYVLYASQGNAEGIKKQHTALLWLVVGITVLIGARVIVQVVINTLSATGTVSPSIIQGAQNALKTP
jgi:uncharacterized protein involved in response to NO